MVEVEAIKVQQKFYSQKNTDKLIAIIITDVNSVVLILKSKILELT